MSEIKKGAVLNYTTIILTNVVGLLLTPFIIHKLGDAEYGLYTLIGAFVGSISIIDFGLNDTIVRFIAKYRASKDKIGEENFLATTMIIYAFISLTVLIIGSICYINIENIFEDSLSIEEIGKAKIMFLILIFNLTISLPGGSFGGICNGYEAFVFPKTVNIFRYIFRSITVVGLLLFGGKAVALVILDTILNMIIIALNAFYVFKKLEVRFKLHQFEKQLVKRIFSYSVWIFISTLVSQFQWRAGQMVLGIVTNTTVVAIFAVGIVLGSYYGAFAGAISSVFLPRATQMTVEKANGEVLTDMMIKIGRLSLIVLLYILGAFFLFGKQFVLLWVGETYSDSWNIALIIMLAYTVPLTQAFGNSILKAKNKMAFKVIVYLCCIVLGTGLGIILAKLYEGLGMVIGTTIGWVVGQIILNFYYQNTIKLNIIRFFKELINKTLLIFIVILLIGFLINRIQGFDWFNFILKAVLFSLVYMGLMYRFGMLKYEKGIVLKPVLTIINKITKK